MKKTAKETTANLFKRYIWLVDIIYRNEKITFEQIDKSWQRSSLNPTGEQYPLRTFHNHRKAIEEMFEIIIECDIKNEYKYYIDNVEEMQHSGTQAWLLNTLSVSNILNENHELENRILLEKIPAKQNYLSPIVRAMKDCHAITISYQSFWSNTTNTFEVYPYCVKIFKQRWYLVAYNPSKSGVRIYALDRMKNIEPTETSFTIPESFDGEQYFLDSFGVIVDETYQKEEVTIRIHANQNKYIRTLPLHHSQQEIEVTDEYSIFAYNVKPTFDFQQELLSHGGYLEVLSPEWLRVEMKNTTKRMNEKYDTL